MHILHYTLGMFPYRAGGLNKYATDLMIEQSKKHDVSVLMPGIWKPWSHTCFVRKSRPFGKLHCYKMDNAMPLPLLYGIKKPKAFIGKRINKNSFDKLYSEELPEVLHLHTLMGMPEEVLRFFKNKGVKIIFTSHDYFGICPRVNLINQDGRLCSGPSPENCAKCNISSPSTLFLRIRNSDLVLKFRDIIRWIKNIINY